MYGVEGSLPEITVASGKNMLTLYGALMDKKTETGDPAITDHGVSHDGHYSDTIRIAVAGKASDE